MIGSGWAVALDAEGNARGNLCKRSRMTVVSAGAGHTRIFQFDDEQQRLVSGWW